MHSQTPESNNLNAFFIVLPITSITDYCILKKIIKVSLLR